MRIKKYIEVKCSFCKNLCEKEVKEYKRRIKNGKKDFFCDLSCAAKANQALVKNCEFAKQNPSLIKQKMDEYRRLHPNSRYSSRSDELTPFRYYVRKIESRRKANLSNSCMFESNITPEFLKLKWEEQRGLCPYTGYKMQLVPARGKTLPYQASIDRIDSKIGYIKENVEFVCLSVNYGKNGFSKQEMLDFFFKIEHNKI